MRLSRQEYWSGSSWPRDQTWVSCIAGRFFTDWVTKEAPTSLVPKTAGKIFTRKGFISTLLELPVYLSFSRNLTSIKNFARIFTAGMLLWLCVCNRIQATVVSQGSAGWEGRAGAHLSGITLTVLPMRLWTSSLRLYCFISNVEEIIAPISLGCCTINFFLPRSPTPTLSSTLANVLPSMKLFKLEVRRSP